MPSYRLSYFNARGFAEVSRLTLAAAGQGWEDVRFENRDEWLKVKETYESRTVPCLEVDGVQISQNQAVLRYLRREYAYGLYGESNMQKAKVDVVLDDLRDFRIELNKVFFEKDETKKRDIQKTVKEEKFPAFQKKMEMFLAKSGTGYIVGSKLTIADIAVFELFDSLRRRQGFTDMHCSESMKQHLELVKSNPGIDKWLKKRPETEN